MTDITYAPAYARRPAALIDRHAGALAELRQFHDEHQMLEQKVREQERYIARLTEHCNLLADQLTTSREYEHVAMRKLMRLAAHVQTISMIAVEAVQIVKDVKEWEDTWQKRETEETPVTESAHVETEQESPPVAADEENPDAMVDQLEKLPPTWVPQN